LTVHSLFTAFQAFQAFQVEEGGRVRRCNVGCLDACSRKSAAGKTRKRKAWATFRSAGGRRVARPKAQSPKLHYFFVAGCRSQACVVLLLLLLPSLKRPPPEHTASRARHREPSRSQQDRTGQDRTGQTVRFDRVRVHVIMQPGNQWCRGRRRASSRDLLVQ